MKDGAARDPKYDYGEDDDLHVLITGERQEDVSGFHWAARRGRGGPSQGRAGMPPWPHSRKLLTD